MNEPLSDMERLAAVGPCSADFLFGGGKDLIKFGLSIISLIAVGGLVSIGLCWVAKEVGVDMSSGPLAERVERIEMQLEIKK